MYRYYLHIYVMWTWHVPSVHPKCYWYVICTRSPSHPTIYICFFVLFCPSSFFKSLSWMDNCPSSRCHLPAFLNIIATFCDYVHFVQLTRSIDSIMWVCDLSNGYQSVTVVGMKRVQSSPEGQGFPRVFICWSDRLKNRNETFEDPSIERPV